MHREPLQENLLDELTRLVGRPKPLIQYVLGQLLDALSNEFDQGLLAALGPFPMTSWPAIAADCGATGTLWDAALTAGLSPEEVFTALAVLDDHVRRSYGNDSWSRVPDWGPRLACRYNLETAPARAAAPGRPFPSP